jgi:hypothetical protein
MSTLKYYTSTVPAIRSIQKIELALVEAGAHDINKKYEGTELKAISFLMTIEAKTVPFKLPARINSVRKVLWDNVKRPATGTKERIKKQAERTAWRIVQEWVDIQLTMIKLDQAEFLELFLPHVYDYHKDQSFFHTLKSNKYKSLPVFNEN